MPNTEKDISSIEPDVSTKQPEQHTENDRTRVRDEDVHRDRLAREREVAEYREYKKRRRREGKWFVLRRGCLAVVLFTVCFFALMLTSVYIALLDQTKASNELVGGRISISEALSVDTKSRVYISSPKQEAPEGEEIAPELLIHECIASYIEDTSQSPVDWMQKYDRYGKLTDIGYPVELTYTVTGITDTYVKLTTVLVSEDPEMKSSRVFHQYGTGTHHLEIDLLKTGTTYYCYIMTDLANGKQLTAYGSFKVQRSPRILSVSGLHNVRDIGYWECEGEKQIAQGLVIRGCELDGFTDSSLLLTEEGKAQMLTVLNIRTELDLRGTEFMYQHYRYDALGAGVNHIILDSPDYVLLWRDDSKRQIKDIFEVFADPDNYPIYVHDDYGSDETALVCAILEALLGVGHGDILTEYNLTSFATMSNLVSTPRLNTYVIGFINSNYGGLTLQQRTRNYLKDCGLTQEQLDTICQIMLEDIPEDETETTETEEPVTLPENP